MIVRLCNLTPSDHDESKSMKFLIAQLDLSSYQFLGSIPANELFEYLANGPGRFSIRILE
jgi:hypothetical protein